MAVAAFGVRDRASCRARLLGVVVTRSAALDLVLGAYLASDRGLWSRLWVGAPLAILVVVLGIVGGYLTPAERRLAELCDGGDERALATATRRAGAGRRRLLRASAPWPR